MKKSELSREAASLLERMQVVNFGRIENLRIENGSPRFTGETQVIREVKLGSPTGPRPERNLADFVLCAKTAELFAEFARLGTGVVTTIEIQHGLPFRFSVRECVSV